ncbi:uncharacterized protein ACN2A1_014662 [Glossina fuscipes fuscipes]
MEYNSADQRLATRCKRTNCKSKRKFCHARPTHQTWRLPRTKCSARWSAMWLAPSSKEGENGSMTGSLPNQYELFRYVIAILVKSWQKVEKRSKLMKEPITL